MIIALLQQDFEISPFRAPQAHSSRNDRMGRSVEAAKKGRGAFMLLAPQCEKCDYMRCLTSVYAMTNGPVPLASFSTTGSEI